MLPEAQVNSLLETAHAPFEDARVKPEPREFRFISISQNAKEV